MLLSRLPPLEIVMPAWLRAGMTADTSFLAIQRSQAEQVHHPGSPLPFPKKILTAAPTVIYGQEVLYAARGHACMDTGGRAASGTGRRGGPEQAGIQWFNKPFPQRGNDNYRNDNSTRHPLKLVTYSPP